MDQAKLPATADLIDAHPDTPSCALPFLSFGRRRRFAGRIRTVKSYQDNVLLKELLGKPSQGDVLVVDGGGSLACALIGDMIAMLGMNSGWAGAVVLWGHSRFGGHRRARFRHQGARYQSAQEHQERRWIGGCSRQFRRRELRARPLALQRRGRDPRFIDAVVSVDRSGTRETSAQSNPAARKRSLPRLPVRASTSSRAARLPGSGVHAT